MSKHHRLYHFEADRIEQLIRDGMAMWEACMVYELVPDERRNFAREAEQLLILIDRGRRHRPLPAAAEPDAQQEARP